MRSILLGLFLILSFGLSAQTDEANEKIGLADCAINQDGLVIPADGSICENDIAFGMLYQILPGIFDELIPVWRLDNFSVVDGQVTAPSVTGEYYGNEVFFSLFGMFHRLIIYCLVLYSFLLAFDYLGRYLKGEDVSDEETGKGTPKTTFYGAIFGGVFLIPFKSFFIGQFLIFSLAVASLSIANFVFSVFLAGNQNIISQTLSSERITNIDKQVGNVYNRHTYLSDTLYRNLTEIQLCRSQSSKYITSKIAPGEASSPSEYRALYQCAYSEPATGQDLYHSTSSLPDDFIHGPVLAREHNSAFKMLNGVYFSATKKEAEQCKVVQGYSCGYISLKQPNWDNSIIARLIGGEDAIHQNMEKLAQQLEPNDSFEEIRGKIQTQWQEMSKIIRDALIVEWDKEISRRSTAFVTMGDDVFTEQRAIEEFVLRGNRESLSEFSRMYHLAAMNIVTIGYGASPVSQNITPSDMYSGFIVSHMENADKLAELIEAIDCLGQKGYIESVYPTQDFLRSGGTLSVNSNAKCLTILTAEVIEDYPEWDSLDREDMLEKSWARHDELKKEFDTLFNLFVSAHAEQREAVESSFALSLDQGDSGTFMWAKMRTQGYLAAANYAQKATSIINGYKRDLTSIVNNFEFDESKFDNAFVSSSIAEDINGRLPMFFDYSYGVDVLEGTYDNKKTLDPLIASTYWVDRQEKLLRRSTGTLGDEFNIESSNIMLRRLDGFLDRLGIDTGGYQKSAKKCLEDPAACPFPITDPIIELSMVGHEMLDMAAWFYGTAVGLKVMSSTLAPAFSGKADGVPTVGSKGPEMSKAAKGGKMLISGLLALGGIIEFLYDVTAPIMALLVAIAAMLAYLLPLLPKIYLYIAFVGWIMVVVMASFSVLLWSVFWLRFKEKRELIKRASYHFGVELMLKPTFSLISVLFAWYFFYVIAFFIGMGISWIWVLPFGQDYNWIRHIVDYAMIIIVLSFVYFVGLKYAYSLMGDMSGQLLEKLGVKNQKVKDEVSDIVKAIIFDRAQDKIKQQKLKLRSRKQKTPDINKIKEDINKEEGKS